MRAPACVLAATVVVSVTTAASEAGKVSLGTLASTPQGVFQGRVWLLLTSALVADHPIGPSLITFAGLGLVAVAVCGWRVVWAAATLGHAGSAVAVYGAIAGLRIIDPAAFRDVRSLYDYGTSAIIAAWLGYRSPSLAPPNEDHRSRRDRRALPLVRADRLAVAPGPDTSRF